MKTWPTLITLIVLTSQPCTAQATDRLKDLRAVNASTYLVGGDFSESSESRATFERNLENAFRTGLEGMGIDLLGNNINRLTCTVKLHVNDPYAAFSIEVDKREIVAPWNLSRGGTFNWDERMEAVTWGVSIPGMVGLAALSGEDFGSFCVELFDREWREANN